MTSEEVIEVIDNLCEKMGLVVNDATQLIPVYAEYKTFTLIESACFAFAAIIILTVLIIRYARKLKKMGVTMFESCVLDDDPYSDLKMLLWFVGMAMLIFCIALFFSWVFGAIEWQLFPEAEMINVILQLIK